MTPIPSFNALDQARFEIERMARATASPDGARGWWHAARIVRLFGNAARAMKQQAQHARFFAASSPDKAAAYRGAMNILARHTGEALEASTVAACEPASTFAAKKMRGPGWMGWRGFDTAGATKENTSPGGSSSQPSYPSRSTLQRAEFSPSASIRFIYG